jgi:formiminotetrahydrofolate cyclodeaminase
MACCHVPMTGSPAAAELSPLPLAEVLERVAARTPAPGGGSSAGVVCALAAALVEMAAGFAEAPDTAARAAQLRARGLELAHQDLEAYGPVLEALRRPADDPDRPATLASALSAAAAVPLGIAQTAGEVAARARQVAETGSRHLLGDIATAAVLAEAACAAAALLVEINLHGTADPRRGEAEGLARAAVVDRQHALRTARQN